MTSQSAASAKILVWWDLEDCRIPPRVEAHQVAHRMKSALAKEHFTGPVSIDVCGDLEHTCEPQTKDDLLSNGVHLHNVPHGLQDSRDKAFLVRLLSWTLDHPPPATLLLICGARDKSVVQALHLLRLRNYHVLLAYPSDAKPSPSLLGAAAKAWEWQKFLTETWVQEAVSEDSQSESATFSTSVDVDVAETSADPHSIEEGGRRCTQSQKESLSGARDASTVRNSVSSGESESESDSDCSSAIQSLTIGEAEQRNSSPASSSVRSEGGPAASIPPPDVASEVACSSPGVNIVREATDPAVPARHVARNSPIGMSWRTSLADIDMSSVMEAPIQCTEPLKRGQRSFLVRLMKSLEADKLPPSRPNLTERIKQLASGSHPSARHGLFLDVLTQALATGDLVAKEIQRGTLLFPRDMPECWPYVDVRSPQDCYSEGLWESFLEFLQAPGSGHQQFQVTKSRYAAAEVLKAAGPPDLQQLALGELIHMVQLAVSQRRWLTPGDNSWAPLTITLDSSEDENSSGLDPPGDRSQTSPDPPADNFSQSSLDLPGDKECASLDPPEEDKSRSNLDPLEDKMRSCLNSPVDQHLSRVNPPEDERLSTNTRPATPPRDQVDESINSEGLPIKSKPSQTAAALPQAPHDGTQDLQQCAAPVILFASALPPPKALAPEDIPPVSWRTVVSGTEQVGVWKPEIQTLPPGVAPMSWETEASSSTAAAGSSFRPGAQQAWQVGLSSLSSEALWKQCAVSDLAGNQEVGSLELSSEGQTDPGVQAAGSLGHIGHSSTTDAAGKLLRDVKRLLQSLLLAKADGLSQSAIKPTFLKRYGYSLDHKLCGSASLTELLEGMPKIVTVVRQENDGPMLYPSEKLQAKARYIKKTKEAQPGKQGKVAKKSKQPAMAEGRQATVRSQGLATRPPGISQPADENSAVTLPDVKRWLAVKLWEHGKAWTDRSDLSTVRAMFESDTGCILSPPDLGFEGMIDLIWEMPEVARIEQPSMNRVDLYAATPLLRDLAAFIKKQLRRYPSGVNLGQVKTDFETTYGYSLDYEKLGFSKLGTLLQSMPKVCKLDMEASGVLLPPKAASRLSKQAADSLRSGTDASAGPSMSGSFPEPSLQQDLFVEGMGPWSPPRPRQGTAAALRTAAGLSYPHPMASRGPQPWEPAATAYTSGWDCYQASQGASHCDAECDPSWSVQALAPSSWH